MKTKDSSYEKYLLNSDNVSNVTDKLKKADSKTIKNCNDLCPNSNDVTMSECEKPKLCSKAEKKPVIDITLENELSRMSINEDVNKLIPMPIAFIKTEPIEVDMAENDCILNDMKRDVAVNDYLAAKNDYNGRFYESTIEKQDILNCKVSKIVLTTSTLRGIFDKENDRKGLNVISAPGATINALSKIANCEFVACKDQSKVNVVIAAGLNDLDKGHDLPKVKKDMADLKTNIKQILPNAEVNFVRLPLPPTMCKLPDNIFHAERDRTIDILCFNRYLLSLNDVDHDLSLENLGIVDPKISGYEAWFTRDAVFYTGRKHDRQAWRRTEPMQKAMHLEDATRKAFWKECIENFFDYSC